MASPSKQQASARPPASATNSISPPGSSLASSTSKQPPQAHKKVRAPNLLSPNAAYEHPGAGQLEGRRKSTLSANGFFIDYSCTRRRSSTAQQQQWRSNDPLARSQFLRRVISPTDRRPSAMVAGSRSSGQRDSVSVQTAQSAMLHARQRASVSGGSALAGSRKTSIFDPTGHSLAAAMRRKSTMVTCMGGGGPLVSPLATAVEQAATLLAVSRQAAALQRAEQLGGRRKLVERVPVIGCSPTSIGASLAALEETRRYEKLLRKLKRHQKKKHKERIQMIGDESEDDELMCVIDLEGGLYGGESDGGGGEATASSSNSSGRSSSSDRPSSGQRNNANNSNCDKRRSPHVGSALRKKSMRAIRDVGSFLGKSSASQRRRRRRKRRWRSQFKRRGDSFVDGLSISSTLSFASSQTSLPSIERSPDELSLYPYGEVVDNDDSECSGARWANEDEREAMYFSEGQELAPGSSFKENNEPEAKVEGWRLSRLASRSADQFSNLERRRRQRRASSRIDGDMSPRQANVGNNNEDAAARGGERDDDQLQLQLGPFARRLQAGQAPATSGNKSKSSLVGKAMRRIAATLRKQQSKPPPPGETPTGRRRRHAGDSDTGQQQRRRRPSRVLSKQAPGERAHRRRSVSMSTSLNYWHYYYYLRQNSMDQAAAAGQDQWGLPALLPVNHSSGSSGGVASCSLSAPSDSLTNQAALSASSPAQAGASHPKVPLGVGTPMDDSERRTRLYVNYSLARLEILNCQTDPVALVARKLAQASRTSQPELLAGGRQQDECDRQLLGETPHQRTPLSPALERPFDFSVSSDDEVALSLSTSSSRLTSSDTSRNSSSLSSPVSTVSSLAIGFGQDSTSAASNSIANDKLEQQQQRLLERGPATRGAAQAKDVHQQPQELPTKHQDSRASSVLCSPQSSSATIRRTTDGPVAAAHRYRRGHHQQDHDRGCSPPPASLSLSTHSTQTSYAQACGAYANFGHQRQPSRYRQVTPTPLASAQINDSLLAFGGPGGTCPQACGQSARPLERDAHFRFSFKSSRSSGSPGQSTVFAGNRPAWHDIGTWNLGGRLHPHHSHQADAAQQGQDDRWAAGRRHSRTFLSWDRLELAAGECQFQPRQAGRSTADGPATTAGLDSQPAARHPREFSLPLGAGGSAPPAAHLGQARSAAATPSGRRPADLFSAGHQKSELPAASRRSFRQPRSPPTAAGADLAAGGSRVAGWASKSKSFLFQRKLSAKAHKQQDNDESRQPQPPHNNDNDYKPAARSPRNRPSSCKRPAGGGTLAAGGQPPPPRDEQREAADKLLEQFEAQMSQAANLGLARQQQQQTLELARPSQAGADYRQQQQASKLSLGGGGGKSQLSRSSASSSQSVDSSPASSRHSLLSGGATDQRPRCAASLTVGSDESQQRLALTRPRTRAGSPSGRQQTRAGSPQPSQAPARQQLSNQQADHANAQPLAQSSLPSDTQVHRSAEQTASPAQSHQGAPDASWQPQARTQARAQVPRLPRHPRQPQVSSQPQSGSNTNESNSFDSCASSLQPSGANEEGDKNNLTRADSRQSFDENAANSAQPPRARAHSTSANATHQRAQWRTLEQLQRQSHPASVGSAETLRLGRRMSREPWPTQQGDDAHFRLQLSPRLVASNCGANLFDANHNQHQRMPNEASAAPARPSLSARSSAAHLAIDGRAEEQEHPIASAVSSPGYGGARNASNGHPTQARKATTSGGGQTRRDANDEIALEPSQAKLLPNSSADADPGPPRFRANFGLCGARAQNKTNQADVSLNSRALSLSRKNSFTCTLLGARQTGKRSIVICFVKLLNEFKLAADEHKKEQMLAKLMECSERLQEIAQRNEQELLDEHLERQRRRQRRASRLNSWLPSGDTVKHLLNLSPVNKQRLHSVVGPLLGTHSNSSGGSRDDKLSPTSAGVDNLAMQQRRHTTIEPSFQLATDSRATQRPELALKRPTTPAFQRPLNITASSQYLAADMQSNLLASCANNKSDSNINYQATQEPPTEKALPRPGTSHQLQVPSWDAGVMRKHSDPTSFRSSTAVAAAAAAAAETDAGAGHQRGRRSTQAPRSVFLSNGSVKEQEQEEVAAAAPAASNRQRRHTTNVSSVGFLSTVRRPSATAGESQRSRRGTRLFSSAGVSSGPNAPDTTRHRGQSICISLRRRKILLSLKELNRRKFAIKFNTRRQISESLKEQTRANEGERAAGGSRAERRRSTIMQLTSGPAQVPLPDAFLVVYSINDRDSFLYAKSMIEQLRSMWRELQRDVPMPIMLVANKSDLERNREVKIDEGRALAKKHSCKFIEISCAIGFNLDNLLVGLRTQLVLKHHVVLNSILRPGFRYGAKRTAAERAGSTIGHNQSDNNNQEHKIEGKCSSAVNKDKRSNNNILVRFYKRYVMDNFEQEYDCDNFSKL